MNKILGVIGDRTILDRGTTYQPFVSATNYNKELDSWDYGNYFDTFQDAVIYAVSRLGKDTPVTTHMTDIHNNYERCCTAEFLRENYSVSDDDAWHWAADVRERMNDDEDYNSFEDEYINETKEEWVS